MLSIYLGVKNIPMVPVSYHEKKLGLVGWK
jgi:hypothetical protein